ncbi:MAG: F0F1 ATP synthase subunit alpha [Burkholderiales bacterium]|nr:F0F1 ATP synthase subunit alpha [Burkholderiales bacterium]
MQGRPSGAEAFEQWRARLLAVSGPAPSFIETGVVTDVSDGVAIVSGLARALAEELVVFESGVQGLAMDLEPGRLGVVLLGPARAIRPGEGVRRTQRVVSTPVGSVLLGRVVDPLGRPLDGKGAVTAAAQRAVEAEAPGILARTPILRPLATGITAVDAAVPVGLGQRQLIIGDRQTGKTSLAIDAMLNQRRSQLRCIYCAIGQRGDAVARVIHALSEGGMLERSIIVNTGDEEAPGLAYIAPYAAMSMAEHFSAQGKDVLLVFDDLTHHARAYRELSLLLRRPPGREAFPGDIFYVHARLLERAGQFGAEHANGSITALAVVETEAENLSAYIPTNLISITDGQIYLSPRLAQKNQFPAVDLGLSVSRVGGKAQNRSLRQVSANLRVTLSQFEALEDFARFGTRLDPGVRARLRRGAAVRLALRQAERDPMSTLEQLTLLLAAMEGLLDECPEQEIAMHSAALRAAARRELGHVEQRIDARQALSDADRTSIIELAREALQALRGGVQAPAPRGSQ